MRRAKPHPRRGWCRSNEPPGAKQALRAQCEGVMASGVEISRLPPKASRLRLRVPADERLPAERAPVKRRWKRPTVTEENYPLIKAAPAEKALSKVSRKPKPLIHIPKYL